MSNKLYKLLVAIVGAVATIANALIVYFNPPMAVALVASITIVATAADDIMANFVKDTTESKS